jgi:stage II sporulation protein D (peptidoglycan lytic transglycosylase)
MLKALKIAMVLLAFLATEKALAYSNTVHIGIFYGLKPTSIIISPAMGEYVVYADGKKAGTLKSGDALQASMIGGKIFIKTLNENLGQYAIVTLIKKEWGATFKIKPLSPGRKERIYPDDITLTVKDNHIQPVNDVNIEHYVAGVVKSEAGMKKHPEYNKVQAIICRTYALNNLYKHKAEGFELCDRVHCQVYLSGTTYPNVVDAVVETKGNVLVDHDINLITASFHSNCGGETANSEDVWLNKVTYLRARQDSFCLNMPNAKWEKTIPKQKWLNYLETKHSYPMNDSLQMYCAVNFCPQKREVYLLPLDSTVQLKNIRKDWKLKSAHFSVEEQNDKVVLKGNGFGHGVGLCQEGGMRMANLGYSYTDIIHFYYTDVHLVHLSLLDFFRE